MSGKSQSRGEMGPVKSMRHPTGPRPAVREKPWHYDELTEASILGAHFAQAIAVISTGHVEEVLQANAHTPTKKVFFEEPRNNPPLHNTHISHEYDAYQIEQDRYWRKNGTVFPVAKRECKVPAPPRYVKTGPDPDHGMKMFGRTREIKPLLRRKKLLTQTMKHDTSTVKAQELRTESIGPTTYSLADPWSEKLKPVCGMKPESSVFKSGVQRFVHPLPTSAQGSRPAHHSMESLSACNNSAQILMFPPAPAMVGPSSQSLDGLDSWDSIAFDNVGDHGSVELFRPQTSPDLVITAIRPNSSQLQQPFQRSQEVHQDQLDSPSRSRSAGLARSKIPGYSFGSKLPERSAGLETASHVSVSKDLSMSVEIQLLIPPKSAPAALPTNPGSKQSLRPPSLQLDRMVIHRGDFMGNHESQHKEGNWDSLDQPSNVSALTPATAALGPSVQRNMLAKWNPPLCYSKKPLFERIRAEQKELKEQKLSQLMEMRGQAFNTNSYTNIDHLPYLSPVKPFSQGAAPRPDGESMIWNTQQQVRSHTTGASFQ